MYSVLEKSIPANTRFCSVSSRSRVLIVASCRWHFIGTWWSGCRMPAPGRLHGSDPRGLSRIGRRQLCQAEPVALNVETDQGPMPHLEAFTRAGDGSRVP